MQLLRLFALSICLSFVGVTQAQSLSRAELAKYAAALAGKKKAELKTAIYTTCQPESLLSYGSGVNSTWGGFYSTDRIASTNECVNRYSSSKFYFTECGKAPSGMNIEHSFPKSWWGGGGNPDKDLFNLYPSDSKANSSKSNYAMGVVQSVSSSSGDGYDLVGTGTIDGVSGVNCWEPGNQYKGDFARSYMYMATIYQNYSWQSEGTKSLTSGTWPTLKQWAYTLYLQWTAADSVSQLEVDRNNAIYQIQGNRNLFIDFPYLAEYVWGDSVNVAFDPYTAVTTASDDHRYISAGGSSSGDDSGNTGGGDSGGDNTGGDTGGDDSGKDDPNGEVTYYLQETFDQCESTGGNDGSFSTGGSGTFKPDVEGWECNKCFAGYKCARFGSSSSKANVTTPLFTVPAGQTTLTFVVAPWGSDGTSLTLSLAAGDATLSQTDFTMVTGEWTTFTITLTATQQTQVQINFAASKRLWMDSFSASGQQADAILSPSIPSLKHNLPIYDLTGRPLGTDSSRLPSGIYVQNGRKFLVK